MPIELRKYVTEESIQEYNNNLPDERTVKNFSDKMMWYKIINNCGVPVYFYIDNRKEENKNAFIYRRSCQG